MNAKDSGYQQSSRIYNTLYKAGIATVLAAVLKTSGCVKSIFGYHRDAPRKPKANSGQVARAPKTSRLETTSEAEARARARVRIKGPVTVGPGGIIDASAGSGSEAENTVNLDHYAPCGFDPALE